MYDETAGIQCRSNAIIAVCFSAVKNVSIWKSWDLDFILDQGDILMQSLSLSLNIEGFDSEVRMGFCRNSIFNNNDLFAHQKDFISSDDICNSEIFTCAGLSFALICHKTSGFVFDSHNNRNGHYISYGQSVLLEFRSVKLLNLFIINYFEQNLTTAISSQYDFQCIKIVASHFKIF